MFQEVAVPGQGEDPAPELLLAEIAAWVRSEPLQSLITRFGGRLAADGLAEQLAYLDEFTASAWNFRRRVSDGPKERNQVAPARSAGRMRNWRWPPPTRSG